MSPEQFEAAFAANPAAMDRLRAYARLLADWQTRMNLVAPSTLDDIWGRHFADSAQLGPHVPRGTLLDMGAGGGFPGLVLAALDHGPVVLVESIAKKCRFLEAVRDAMGVEATVVNARVEALPTLGVACVTARAAAPLATLFDWGIRHARPGGRFVLPKGRRWAGEVAAAAARFHFRFTAEPSMTDPDARIIVASGLKRR